jgi:hypothetical protein
MNKISKKIIAYIVLLCCTPVALFWTSFNSQAFHDNVGNTLAIGICANVVLAIFCKLMTLFKNVPKANLLFRICCGIAIILWGCWIYGEKTRFANHPVIKTDAIITDAYFYTRAPWIEISYQYRDMEGHGHNGKGYESSYLPNEIWMFMSYKNGDIIPINYLKDAPDISRLVESHYIQIYFARFILILIGALIIAGGIRGARVGSIFFRIKIRKK